jgi:hypothetical protein
LFTVKNNNEEKGNFFALYFAMAQVFTKRRDSSGSRDEQGCGGDGSRHSWAAVSVDADVIDLEQLLERVLEAPGGHERSASFCRVSDLWGGETWLLVGGRSVRVNGIPLLAGICLLEHRDEIRVDGLEPVWFSTEKLARIQPFPGSDQRTECPRCKLEIKRGHAAVRCPAPGCGAWVHMDPEDELPCWQYGQSKTCPSCEEPNLLAETWTWLPDDD